MLKARYSSSKLAAELKPWLLFGQMRNNPAVHSSACLHAMNLQQNNLIPRNNVLQLICTEKCIVSAQSIHLPVNMFSSCYRQLGKLAGDVVYEQPLRSSRVGIRKIINESISMLHGLNKMSTMVDLKDEKVNGHQKPNNATVEECAEQINEIEQPLIVDGNFEALEASLKELDAVFPPDNIRIGATCLRLAQLCVSNNKDPDKILMYGQRALKLMGTPEVSLASASCLEVIGCAYYKKGEFQTAVTQLEKADMILDRLKAEVDEKEIGTLKYAVQALLGQVNMALGREGEALLNFQEAVAANERVLGSHHPDLAKSYRQAAEVHMQAKDLDEALNLLLKALPIYEKNHGTSSSQVVEVRKLISIIYYEMDEFDKVLSEHKALRPILEDIGDSEELAALDLASGEALICLEQYPEAISKLKQTVNESTPASCYHGQALVLIAKAHALQEKCKDAIVYSQKALAVLKPKKQSLEAGASLVELASVLQTLKEYDKAFSTLNIALEQYPADHEVVPYIEGQIGVLYLTLEKANEALPYLERAAAKNESIYGEHSRELLDVYNHLGIAYLNLGKFEEALTKLEAARVIATQDNAFEDPITITLHNNLAHVYTAVGRIGDALMCQKLLVDSIKKTGIEDVVSLEEAERKLNELLDEASKKKS